MTGVEKGIIATGSTGAGGLVWGISTGMINNTLDIALGLLGIAGFITYIIYQIGRIRGGKKIGKAKYEAAKAEAEAHKAQAEFWKDQQTPEKDAK